MATHLLRAATSPDGWIQALRLIAIWLLACALCAGTSGCGGGSCDDPAMADAPECIDHDAPTRKPPPGPPVPCSINPLVCV